MHDDPFHGLPLQASAPEQKFGSMKPKNAVAIYRVSTKKQLDGESIERQRQEVRKYCEEKGYTLLKEFELAETGSKTEERHKFNAAINYCLANHKKIAAVVIWKVNRFSRGGMNVYYGLKALLSQRGIRVESATEHIDETPIGEMMESMLAANARFDNRIRIDLTIGNEKRLPKKGFWVRPAPTCFENAKVPVYDDESGAMKKRPILRPTRDTRQWELLQHGLRQQLSGLHRLTAVAKELHDKGFVTRTGKLITPQSWLKICRSPVYGGWICEKWTEGEMVPAKFDGAISRDEWLQLQEVLNRGTRQALKLPRKKLREELPLRQFLCCPKCGRRVTGCRSRGKMGKHYFYYGCSNRECGFGVRADKAHDLFRLLLKELKPSRESLEIFRKVMVEKWKARYVELSHQTTDVQKRVLELREKKERLLTLMEANTQDAELLADLKQRYQDTSKELTLATMERQDRELEEYDVEAVLNYCTYFMENALELWNKAPVEEKFRFQSLIFPSGVNYSDLETNQTPPLSLIYEAFKDFQDDDDSLAEQRCFTPQL